jgi:solute carrier family 35 (UDP-sugar transporter), member A1/2/3
LLLPGLLYTLQNNLQYVAASNLEPAVFQVTYQIKMLTTAILSVTMLNKQLKPRQWGGVSLLMVGLVLVQLSQGGSGGLGNKGGDNTLVGFSAVLSACTLAGFAGCYLERVLKGCTTSLWIRNIQLSIWGTILGLISMMVKDGSQVYNNGFFYGYDKLVFTVIGIQAIGGLLISLVVRYGDALVKGFATGLAIILTTIVSVYMFDFKITPTYLSGSSITLLAVLMYSGVLAKLFAVLAPFLSAVLSGTPWMMIDNALIHQEEQDISQIHDYESSNVASYSAYPWSLVAGGAANFLVKRKHARSLISKWF